MKLVETMMGWRHPTDGHVRLWVNHHGEYRDRAEPDDILSWFQSHDYVLCSCAYTPLMKVYVVSLVSATGDVVAQGATLQTALIKAVETITA